MLDKLSENLKLLMTEIHISADELARRTHIPASTIKKIRNLHNPNPTLTTLMPLAEFFSITLGQLVGSEPMPESRLKGSYQPNQSSIQHIPLISWEDSIKWPNIVDKQTNTITTEYLYNQNSFALTVTEDDWENLTKGTALIVDPSLKPDHRDFAIIYKEGLEIPMLRQILYDDEQIYLKPVVKGFNITTLTPEHKILGVVVEYKKSLKPLSKTAELY